MKILAHVHLWPPAHNAGAEWMMLSILRWMVGRGHEARVLVRAGGGYSFKGVDVVQGREPRDVYPWADVVLTHLDVTAEAMLAAEYTHRPLVHVVHNDAQLRHHAVTEPALIVSNSRWIARAAAADGFDSLVVHPPVFVDDYIGDADEHDAAARFITLVNMFGPKGTALFRELARLESERSFLAIRGAYGEQEDRDMPNNVTIEDQRPEARTIYSRTRVLLMPSRYESYGRCAVEAACSGIPTIATPTIGLLEALGPAGIYASSSDIDAWREAIAWLDEPEHYIAASCRSLSRAEILEERSEVELVELEKALEDCRRR